MTRFEREISGALGEYWKKSAEREVQQAVKKADAEAIVEENGAIKWKSNGHYLMDDFCEKLEYANYPFSRIATEYERDAQNKEFFKSYKAKQHSEEEISAMRAAFGKGAVVVDVISGERIQL